MFSEIVQLKSHYGINNVVHITIIIPTITIVIMVVAKIVQINQCNNIFNMWFDTIYVFGNLAAVLNTIDSHILNITIKICQWCIILRIK